MCIRDSTHGSTLDRNLVHKSSDLRIYEFGRDLSTGLHCPEMNGGDHQFNQQWSVDVTSTLPSAGCPMDEGHGRPQNPETAPRNEERSVGVARQSVEGERPASDRQLLFGGEDTVRHVLENPTPPATLPKTQVFTSALAEVAGHTRHRDVELDELVGNDVDDPFDQLDLASHDQRS